LAFLFCFFSGGCPGHPSTSVGNPRSKPSRNCLFHCNLLMCGLQPSTEDDLEQVRRSTRRSQTLTQEAHTRRTGGERVWQSSLTFPRQAGGAGAGGVGAGSASMETTGMESGENSPLRSACPHHWPCCLCTVITSRDNTCPEAGRSSAIPSQLVMSAVSFLMPAASIAPGFDGQPPEAEADVHTASTP